MAIHQPHRTSQITLRISLIAGTLLSGGAAQEARGDRTSRWSSKAAVAAATASTASPNASALCPAGARKPLIFRTYCNAAARMSSSVTCSAKGGRRVLMLRHILRPYAYRGSGGSSPRVGGTVQAEQPPQAHGEAFGKRAEVADG